MPGPRDGVGAIAYVVRSYPRLSQTFILDEFRALERLGLELRIFSLIEPSETLRQPEVAEVRAPVRYLDPASRGTTATLEHLAIAIRSPVRYARALVQAATSRDAERGHHVATRWRCFMYAVALVAELRRSERETGVSVRRLHAHFAHDPAMVGLLAHRLTGIPFSFTAHARDLYQVSPSALAARIDAAEAVVTCCRANAGYLSDIARPAAERIHVIHHGLDLDLFPFVERDVTPGDDRARSPVIVSVGRLVPKKGFDDLLAAAARLDRMGHRFRLRIFGDGPAADRLRLAVEARGLGDVVEFLGATTRRAIIDALSEADVFALTPVVTPDGNRDGIPNALVEAMGSGLAPVSTRVGGITELITHGTDGLLAAPGDVAEITDHLAALLADPAHRTRLGVAARQMVETRFDLTRSAERLAAMFGLGPHEETSGAAPVARPAARR